jgi:hypothetical protein
MSFQSDTSILLYKQVFVRARKCKKTTLYRHTITQQKVTRRNIGILPFYKGTRITHKYHNYSKRSIDTITTIHDNNKKITRHTKDSFPVQRGVSTRPIHRILSRASKTTRHSTMTIKLAHIYSNMRLFCGVNVLGNTDT